MYAYVANNPVMGYDPDGYFSIPFVNEVADFFEKAGNALGEYFGNFSVKEAAFNWLLTQIDGPLPFADIYIATKTLSSLQSISKNQTESSSKTKSKSNAKTKSKSKTSTKNLQKLKDKFLKDNGIDAHGMKDDYKAIPNARYDLYINKDDGYIWIYPKGAQKEGIKTYFKLK